MTEEQGAAAREAAAEQRSASRANRTEEEVDAARVTNAAAERDRRANRTAEEADVVQANDTAAHREQRTNRTAEEAAVHRVADTCRKRVTRQASRVANDDCEADDEDVEVPTGRRRRQQTDRYVPFPRGGFAPPDPPTIGAVGFWTSLIPYLRD